MAEPKHGKTFPGSQWSCGGAKCQSSILELRSTCSVPHYFSEHFFNCCDWPGKSLLHRTLPSPSQDTQIKLKSTHWQVMAGWWLRLHLGSCISRKPIFSWSFCPVFQLLLCRLKLIGGTSEESTLLCNLYVSESPSKARLSLSTSNNPEVKTCPSILDTAYPPVIFKLILLK